MSDSSDLEAHFRIVVDGKGELEQLYTRGEAGAKRFSENTNRYLQRAGSAMSAFSGKAKSELNAFAGKELGGSLGTQARGVLELRDAINKLAVSAGGGQGMVGGLKDEIQAVSVASNQLQGDVTQAMQAFVERTGNIEVARRNLELYAKTATATSASLEDVARVGEALFSKFKITDQKKSFDILATQAKSGAIELRDIATQGSSVFAAARAGGLPANERGVAEIGAFLQTIAGGARGKGKTTAADTAVQANAIFSQILQKANRLEAIGINVQGRDQIDVLKEIIVKSHGDPRKLKEVFTNVRAFRGVEEMARDYRETGTFKNSFDKYLNMGSDPNTLANDFKFRMTSGVEKLKANEIGRNRFYDTYFGGIAEFGAEHATALQVGSYGVGLAGKGLSLAGRYLGSMGGVAGRLGGAVSAATAQRVFVVNMPAGGFGGGGGPGAQGVGLLGAAGQLLGAGVAGVAIGAAAGDYLDKHSTTARKFYEGEAKLLGRLTGQTGKMSAIEAAGIDINQTALQRRAMHRADLTLDYEMKGLTHGAALNAADQQIKAEVQNLTVNINGNEASVETDQGTRSPKVMVRRNGGAEDLD